jgi:hypothetical protein
MQRLTALRWLSAVLLISTLLGSFPPPSRAHVSGHSCCRGQRVCHCAAHSVGSRDAAGNGTHSGCALRAAGCTPAAAAPTGSPTVLVVLSAGAPLIPPARLATTLPSPRASAQVASSRPDIPPPRFLG